MECCSSFRVHILSSLSLTPPLYPPAITASHLFSYSKAFLYSGHLFLCQVIIVFSSGNRIPSDQSLIRSVSGFTLFSRRLAARTAVQMDGVNRFSKDFAILLRSADLCVSLSLRALIMMMVMIKRTQSSHLMSLPPQFFLVSALFLPGSS